MKTSERSVGLIFLAAAVSLATFGGFAGGCDRSDSGEKPSEQKGADDSKRDDSPIEYIDGPTPEADTVVAKVGDVTVSFGEYEAYLRQSRMFRPGGGGEPISKMKLARPKAQVGAVRALLRAAMIDAEVKRRNLTPSQSDIVKYVTQSDKWSPYAGHLIDGDEAQKPLPDGVKPSDLEAIARRALNRKRLEDDLLEKMKGEKIWDIYKRRHDRISLLVAGVGNSPSPDNIDAFIEEEGVGDDSPIRRYFEANKQRFGTPKQVKLTMLVPQRAGGSDSESPAEDRLEEAARRLGDGDDPATVAEDLNMEVRRNQHLVRRENRKAFQADSGATGYQTDGPRGAYAWRVEGWREPKAPTLEGATLREVASEAMQKEIVPSARKTIARAESALRELAPRPDGSVSDEQLEKLKNSLQNDELEFTHTGMFANNGEGRVPKIGLAEPIVEKAFELSEVGSVADEPILSRGQVYTFRILKREKPSREEFESNREEFRQKVLEAERDSIVATFLSGWMDKHNPDLNLEPIQVKYGVIRKKGS